MKGRYALHCCGLTRGREGKTVFGGKTSICGIVNQAKNVPLSVGQKERETATMPLSPFNLEYCSQKPLQRNKI